MDIASLVQNTDSGFAIANDVVLEDLQKALSSGYETDAASLTGGQSLIPESLDTTLVSVLHSQDEAKLFKILKKEPVSSTVHQYVKRSDVGDDDGAWVSEGGDSFEKNQTLTRVTLSMKYLQTLRKVTLQMATAKTIEDATALEQTAGTLWIVRNVEKKLFKGNQSCVTEEVDGLDVICTTNVIDMRGGNASSADFESKMTEACRKIRERFGKASMLYSSTMVMEDIQALLRDRIRFPITGGGGGARGGANYVIDIYPTKFGKPLIEDNVFITEGATPSTSALTGVNPGQVTFTALREAADGGRVSEFAAGDAGDYYYQVAAENKFGDGVVASTVQVTNIIAGDQVKLSVTDVGTVGTSYKIYRSKKDASDGTDCRFMYRAVNPLGGPSLMYDLNAYLPGCSNAYILTMDAIYNAIEWNQFLPMMKFTLYPTNAAVYPFLMLLFGAMNVKKEEQMAIIENISYTDMGWF